jgi:hypothetical protein
MIIDFHTTIQNAPCTFLNNTKPDMSTIESIVIQYLISGGRNVINDGLLPSGWVNVHVKMLYRYFNHQVTGDSKRAPGYQYGTRFVAGSKNPSRASIKSLHLPPLFHVFIDRISKNRYRMSTVDDMVTTYLLRGIGYCHVKSTW